MIDVVFLLLIFFLTTSSFQRLEKLMPSAVSAEAQSQGGESTEEPPQPTESDLSDCVIKISLEGGAVRYLMNDQEIASLETLAARIKGIVGIRPDVPIVIDPSDEVPARDAIRVYDIARSLGSIAVYLVGR
jgi:biopolymer transport protein ExbD